MEDSFIKRFWAKVQMPPRNAAKNDLTYQGPRLPL